MYSMPSLARDLGAPTTGAKGSPRTHVQHEFWNWRLQSLSDLFLYLAKSEQSFCVICFTLIQKTPRGSPACKSLSLIEKFYNNIEVTHIKPLMLFV